MRTLFVDTSAWCALYNRGDPGHALLLTIWQGLKQERARFVTSDYVLAGTLALIHWQAGPRPAIRFGELVRMSSLVQVERIDPALHSAAWQLYQRYEDPGISFVDCTSFALMRRLGLTEVLTLDRRFARAGFAVLPGA